MHDAINSSMTTFMGRINNHALGLTVALGAIFLGDVKAQTAVSAPNQTSEFEAVMRHIPKRNIGPGAMSGRVTALAMPRKGALESVNRHVIYAGTALSLIPTCRCRRSYGFVFPVDRLH